MVDNVFKITMTVAIIALFIGAETTPIVCADEDPVIYIEGILRIYDEVDDEWEGCFGTKVEIWDKDVIGNDLLLTLIIEEDNGHFSAVVSNNDGAGGGQEIFLKFITENDYVAVSAPYNPFCYWSDTPVEPEANDYDTLNFNFEITQGEAWHIQRWLYKGYKFVSDKISSKIEAEWPSSGSEYSKFLHFFKEIRLLAGDEWDDSVILHEYGHFVMDEVYGYQPPVNYGADAPDHSFGSQETKSTAWSEGWPSFFQAAVRDNPHYYDRVDQDIDYNYEDRLTMFGEDIEGNIIKILWDLYDSNNEIGDNFDMSFDDIWAAFSNHETSVIYPGYGDHVDEIKEFWNNWLEIYGDDNLIDLIRVFYLNRIDYRPSDSFGYKFLDNQMHTGPTYDWIDISNDGNQILPSSDDSWVVDIDLGFFFNYYGTDYSQLAIGNNGLLFSGEGTWQYINQPITQTPSIHGFIAPYWDDIVTWGSADAIYYKTIGTAPDRMFVVQWNDNQHYSSSTSGITFEAILYEGTNNILFQYKDVDFGTVSGAVGGDNPPYNNGGSATIGIEDPTGNIGLQYSFNEQVITPGLAILFKFPAFSGTNMHLSMNAPASMDHGNIMTYSLYYNDFGSVEASNVVLQATLSSNVDFISASDGGTYDSDTRIVTWDIGNVPAFPSGMGLRTVTVEIPSSIPVGTIIQATASISTTTLETRYDDNDASAQTTVTGSNLPPNVGVSPTLGNSGGNPVVYWHTPITFSYYSDCATSIDIIIHINDGGPDITGAMTETTPDTWTYTISFSRYGTATTTYDIEGCSVNSVSFNIYIDPAGYIYNVVTGDRIEGAVVTLQRPDGAGDWENVPTGELPSLMIPDINPQITGADGQYQWDVIAGTYRVHVEAIGYLPADSIVVNIPPPVTDLHVGLIPIDTEPPIINIIFPSIGDALQDGVTIETVVSDPSGVDWVTYSIRYSNGGTGDIIDSSFESLNAVNIGGDTWQLPFDTTQLPDGFYVLLVNASDLLGNEGYETVEFSIRNWAVVELLPSTPRSKAGRTMPVKFSIRVAEAVDPDEPFVWNEDLTILIYEEGHPEDILQESTYGETLKDYRISSEDEHYITNFKTSKKPKAYVVEIWRNDMLLDSFEFETAK